MRRILVTAISGNVSNGILKVLKETDDVVFGCDIYDYPVGMDKVVAYWKSDLAEKTVYIDNLLTKCKEYNITHLIPANEVEIKVINENIERFKNINVKVMINNSFIIETFLDKYKTYEYLSSLKGIYVPQTYTYNEFIEDGREYFIKLKKSCGSKFTKRIKSKFELENLNLCKEEYIIQEYLPNVDEEYTVGVFSDGNEIFTIAFKRKLKNGYTDFLELVHDEKIESEAIRIAKSVELKGYINIQLRKQNGRNYIFEVNPRISGTVFFRYMLDFKDVIWWLDLLDGKMGIEYRCKCEVAIGMRELTEKFVIMR